MPSFADGSTVSPRKPLRPRADLIRCASCSATTSSLKVESPSALYFSSSYEIFCRTCRSGFISLRKVAETSGLGDLNSKLTLYDKEQSQIVESIMQTSFLLKKGPDRAKGTAARSRRRKRRWLSNSRIKINYAGTRTRSVDSTSFGAALG